MALKPKPKERKFVLRLPEDYAVALDALVESGSGIAKSRNDLIVKIIGFFLEELKRKGERRLTKSER